MLEQVDAIIRTDSTFRRFSLELDIADVPLPDVPLVAVPDVPLVDPEELLLSSVPRTSIS